MGLISGFLSLLFGNGRNVVRETAEVFRENAEAGAERAVSVHGQAMAQFAAEFQVPRKGGFDRFMDGINRIPRPALALGAIGLFVTAMVDPLWFAARMQGIALVPEPLWWLFGVVVSFYFGARHQSKAQDLQREIAATMIRAPEIAANARALQRLRHDNPGNAETNGDAELAMKSIEPDDNPALTAWLKQKNS